MSFYSHDLPYRNDAAHYFAAIVDLPWAVWLDSCSLGRYDILTAAPQQTLQQDLPSKGDSFEHLRHVLGETASPVEDIPFAGGALGYWGYDMARNKYGLPDRPGKNSRIPDMAVGIYDWALVLDHQKHKARVVSWRRFETTEKLLPQIIQRLQTNSIHPGGTFRIIGGISTSFTKDGYVSAFNQVQEYLQQGDCYQVNLAQCFSAKAEGNALAAYLQLRSMSPAPYAAYMNLPQVQILCASPERFLSVRNGNVQTKPIKGTRPRGSNPQRDQQLAEELRTHPKDRAENLMIVDLLRNDLGMSCEPGTVRVPELFGVESFATVHHLVSTVEGKLEKGRDALHVLEDCFPGGSITGAPKRRAMQIIDQLEPHCRGIYCGAIGYLGFDGNMDSNIVIRTLVYANHQIQFCAGGGIVADSDVEAEYREIQDKAAAMLDLLQRLGAEGGAVPMVGKL